MLVIVNGVCGNTAFVDAVSLASYSREEGWILDEYPEWENPGISFWAPIRKGTCSFAASGTAGGWDGMSEFVDCRTCKTDCVRADGNYGYTFCDKYTHPPITNADRIRAMSDEELANLLADYTNNSGWVTEIGRAICFERIYKWLQLRQEGKG